ncbi:MAG: transporter permease subunit [Acidobacteriota bacterium]|nr:transporter permease subunit [Acidobacteriota bacterium]
MKTFKTFLIYEIKQFFCLRNSIIIVMMLVLSLIFIQVGVARFKSALDKKQKFRGIEKQKVEKCITYTQYGAYVARYLFIPDSLSILFTNSGVIKDMEGFVDSGERQNIYMPLLGKNLFAANRKWPVDFAGMILFFGSLLALLYGIDSLSDKEYLRFLETLVGPKQVFGFMIAARLLLLLLLFLAVFACGLGAVTLNGIALAIDGYSLFYCLVMLIAAAGFFAVGLLFGTLKFKNDGVHYALCCWFVLLFVIPIPIDFWAEEKANEIVSIYELEMEKLNIVMDFEKPAIAEAWTFNYGKTPSDRDRELVSSYRENDFKKIQALEENLKKQMQESISRYHRLAMLTPAGFYFSVCTEAGSAGYKNAIDYSDYVRRLRSEFVRFHITKIYSENSSTAVPFVKGEQDVYIARPRLPGYYAWGLLLNVLYIGLFIRAAHCRHKKTLVVCAGDARPAKAAASASTCTSHTLKLAKGDFKVWDVRGDFFRSQLYNLLSGKSPAAAGNEPGLQMTIDDRPLGITAAGKQKENFLYLCHVSDLPGKVRAGNFLSFCAGLMKTPEGSAGVRQALLNKNINRRKKIKRLSEEELAGLLVCLLELKTFDIYLVNDIARGMSPEFARQVKEKFEALAAAGSTILFINTTGQYWLRKNASSRCFIELPVWGKVVDSLVEK